MRHRSSAEQHPVLLGLGILFGVAFGAFLVARLRSGATANASGCTPPSPHAPTTNTPRSCAAMGGAARWASISLRRGGGPNACLAWPGRRRSTRQQGQPIR